MDDLTVIRSDRLEIPRDVKRTVFLRAGGPERLVCEGCSMPIGGKRFDYDHKHAEVFQNLPKAERAPITPEDVQLLGYDCCHKWKSAQEHKDNCKGKRILKKAAGIKTKGRPLPGTRASGVRKRMNGDVEAWW